MCGPSSTPLLGGGDQGRGPGCPWGRSQEGDGRSALVGATGAAGNPSAPEDVIRAGAVDHSPWVRAAVAGNANAPEELIAVAVRDRNQRVREAVASSPCITEEAAERLSRSKVREIQRRLAKNPAVPERIRVVALMRAETFH